MMTQTNKHMSIPSKPSLRAKLLSTYFRYLVKPTMARLSAMPIEQLRQKLGPQLNRLGYIPKGIEIKRDQLNGVDVDWISDEAVTQKHAVLLYFHGGAMVLATPKLHAAFVGRLVKSSGIKAVMPAYRLAPEHPYPAAPNDAISCYRGLLDAGYSAEQIILAGDSAGGNLVATTLLAAKQQQLPMPAAAVLISPPMDLSSKLPSHEKNRDKDCMLDTSGREIYLRYYLGENINNVDSEAMISPYLADFSQFPPLYFIASDSEVLTDDSLYSAQKAQSQGVEVRCELWPGLPHAFAALPPLLLPEAKLATQKISAFMLEKIEQHSAVSNQ